MTDTGTSRRRLAEIVVGLTVIVIMLLVAPGTTSAHTDFDSSEPADGTVVDGPIDQVTITFTQPAEPVGDGFELLDGSGEVRAPTSIDPTDGTRFVLGFDPPLVEGEHAVRWNVRAGDAHPIDGAFQFTVEGVPSAPDPTSPPPTDPPAGSTAPDSAAPDSAADADETDDTAAIDDSAAALDEFLASPSSDRPGDTVGRFGRGLTFMGTIFAMGAAAALFWVVRGERRELGDIVAWIRLAGLAIGVGGVVELAALHSTLAGDLDAVLDSRAGVAAVLKMAAGIAVWVGFRNASARVVAPPQTLSAAVATPPAERWTPTTWTGVGLAGFALALTSFWFDGHTATDGPWPLHSAANLAHVLAAAVWGGGLLTMTLVAWRRHRRSAHTGSAEMVIRFSTPASASLAAVAAAGVVMTIMIADQPGDLVSTSWGRLLLLKTGVVAVAAGLGGYNHLRLRPALTRSPDDPDLASRLRRTLTAESVTFAAILVITAWLVAAAT
ncbi:MAG: CopD family protein [Thermoleophilaceae bacterium]